jgi:hypothetical protein
MRLLSTILASFALVLVTHSAVAAGKGPSASNAAGKEGTRTREHVTFTITGGAWRGSAQACPRER